MNKVKQLHNNGIPIPVVGNQNPTCLIAGRSGMAGIELVNLDDDVEQELDIGKAPSSVRFLLA